MYCIFYNVVVAFLLAKKWKNPETVKQKAVGRTKKPDELGQNYDTQVQELRRADGKYQSRKQKWRDYKKTLRLHNKKARKNRF